MEFEDNKNAFYCDPNAYIQNCSNQQTQKVVFQEPYECLPNRYLNNNFKKHDCNCVPTPKSKCDCKKEQKPKPNSPFSFDIKNLLPILSGLSGGNNAGIGNIISMLSKGGTSGDGGFDISKILSLFLSGGGSNLLGGMFNKTTKKEQLIKSTDIPIKNYTRVD